MTGIPWGEPGADPLGDIRAFRRRAELEYPLIRFTVDQEMLQRGIDNMREAFERLAEGPDMSSTPDAAFYGGPMKLGRTLAECQQKPQLRFQPRITKPGEFGHNLPCWMDEIWEFTTAVIPPPIRGGTFFYCPWNETVREKAGGRVTHWSCGTGHVGWATGTRFRTAKAYRRHYRRCHFS